MLEPYKWYNLSELEHYYEMKLHNMKTAHFNELEVIKDYTKDINKFVQYVNERKIWLS